MGTIARYRLVVVLLTAALLATLTVALTGGDRAEAIDGPVDVVYVATGRNFPDALAGSTLAAADNAPLLTVNGGLPLPPATVNALIALDPDRIIVFGGAAAVSEEVLQALEPFARSGSVLRVSGDDRHGTAAAIADALPDPGPLDADLLDGLDSTDLLGVADTAADSNALGGIDAADLRVLNLGNWTHAKGAQTTTTGLSPRLDQDVDGAVGATFMLPPGHRTGDPIHVDLLVTERSSAACSIRLVTEVLSTVPGGTSGDIVSAILEGETGPVVTFNAPSSRDNHPLTFEFEQTEGDELAAGTAFTFTIFRDADHVEDTCASPLFIPGAQVRY